MSILWIVLTLVALQRASELVYAARNTRRLLAAGGVEVAAWQHPYFVALHAGWLLAMFIVIPRDAAPHWWFLGLYLLLQFARIWTVATLGRFWTTRIITLPGAPLVRAGPYRFVRHPNYLIVAAELIVLPLAFGAWPIALAFTLLNGCLVALRVRAEEAALAPRREV